VDGRRPRTNAAVCGDTAGFDYVAFTATGFDGLEDVRCDRRVWFLKAGPDRWPDVWIIFDDVTGGGEHTADLHYQFAPMRITDDPDCGCVWTTEDDSSNLYVHVAAQPRARLKLDKAGESRPARLASTRPGQPALTLSRFQPEPHA